MTGVSHGTEKLARLRALVLAENERQNLIAGTTIDGIDARHIDDSRQLLPLLPDGPWIDIGSGAGFPGLVLACLRDDPAYLIEPRARRAAFLEEAARTLDLPHVTVHATRVEQVELAPVAAITARAVASLDKLFAMAAHLANEETRWVLPKGRTARDELAAARRAWQGDFSLVASATSPDAAIVVATAVRRRRGG